MLRRSLILAASVVVLIAGLVAPERPLAAEARVTSSDANARFMALGVSKSVVVDLPTDIQDVLVTDPGIVNAVVRTKRRIYLIGAALGQTNVYLFDATGRQIAAFDIAVQPTSPPAELENYPFPAKVVQIFRGAQGQNLSCTSNICVDTSKPGSDQPPGTQNINVTGSTTGVLVSAK